MNKRLKDYIGVFSSFSRPFIRLAAKLPKIVHWIIKAPSPTSYIVFNGSLFKILSDHSMNGILSSALTSN